MCLRSRSAWSGLIALLASGCSALGGGHAATETATVTVTTTGSAQSSTATSSTTTATNPEEPAAVSGLDLMDPSGFKDGETGSWNFTARSGSVVCSFPPAGDLGMCYLKDASSVTWSPADHCEAYKDDDPDGKSSNLVGWESDYRTKPCHGPLQGDWPRPTTALPPGKKVVFQVDTDHGVTVMCGNSTDSTTLTRANNDGHGFTISGAGPQIW